MDKQKTKERIEELMCDYYLYAQSKHLSKQDLIRMHQIGQECLELRLQLLEGED